MPNGELYELLDPPRNIVTRLYWEPPREARARPTRGPSRSPESERRRSDDDETGDRTLLSDRDQLLLVPRDVLEDMAEVLEISRARNLSTTVPIDRLMEAGARQRRRTPQEEGEALVSVGAPPPPRASSSVSNFGTDVKMRKGVSTNGASL